MELTKLSQPSVTRGINALLKTGLVITRPDLAGREKKRGRPAVPVQISRPGPGVYAGVAVGTSHTWVALFTLDGAIVAHTTIRSVVAQEAEEDFLEFIVAAVNRLDAATPQHTLLSVGLSTSGRVSASGLVEAPNLGWHATDLKHHLEEYFDVPVTLSSAVPAILGAELLTAPLVVGDKPTVAFFADDSVGAAITHHNGDIAQLAALPTLDNAPAEQLLATHALGPEPTEQDVELRTRRAGEVAAALITEHRAHRLVVAGNAFTAQPRLFTEVVRGALGPQHAHVELRLIPTHEEIVAAVARAVALEQVMRRPVETTAQAMG